MYKPINIAKQKENNKNTGVVLSSKILFKKFNILRFAKINTSNKRRILINTNNDAELINKK